MTPIDLDHTKGIQAYGYDAEYVWHVVADPAWDIHLIYQMLWEMLRK